jgi:hypothetical protein
MSRGVGISFRASSDFAPGPATSDRQRPPSGHAGRLPSPRVFLAGEEPAFNILFVGHPTPANLSERLATERYPP